MIVHIDVYREGTGSSDTQTPYKSFKVECKDDIDVGILMEFVEAGVNAYEDEKAESIDNEGYVVE